jgi:hypothetical protein
MGALSGVSQDYGLYSLLGARDESPIRSPLVSPRVTRSQTKKILTAGSSSPSKAKGKGKRKAKLPSTSSPKYHIQLGERIEPGEDSGRDSPTFPVPKARRGRPKLPKVSKGNKGKSKARPPSPVVRSPSPVVRSPSVIPTLSWDKVRDLVPQVSAERILSVEDTLLHIRRVNFLIKLIFLFFINLPFIANRILH